jgi:hypothetical protein
VAIRSDLRVNLLRPDGGVKAGQQTRSWQHRPCSGGQILCTLARRKNSQSRDERLYTRFLTAIDTLQGAIGRSGLFRRMGCDSAWVTVTHGGQMSGAEDSGEPWRKYRFPDGIKDVYAVACA